MYINYVIIKSICLKNVTEDYRRMGEDVLSHLTINHIYVNLSD